MRIKAIILITLTLLVNNNFAQIQNNGNLKIHAMSKVAFFGNFTNNGTFNNNLGSLYLVGSNYQSLNGSTIIQVNNLIINKPNNSIKLDNELQIAGELTFNKGRIVTDTSDINTEFVHFLDGSSFIGSSDSSYINGVVRKTGSDAFEFPIGDNNLIRSINISAPTVNTDHFTAFYTESDLDGIYNRNLLDVGLNHISSCEYWVLNRTGGSSNVEVKLSWASNSCGLDNLCDIQLARWNGVLWTSDGNGGTSGSTVLGTVISGTSCTTPVAINNFGLFTLGSSSINNPLPIELLSFQVNKCNTEVCLLWETATEINNDYFTIERSIDSQFFIPIQIVDGAGNSNTNMNYYTSDEKPISGVSYYRLKQTDFDGQSSYSRIKSITFDGLENIRFTIFPNPTKNVISITGSKKDMDGFKIFNVLNQDITFEIELINVDESKYSADLTRLSSGIYFISNSTSVIKVFKQ